MKIGILGCAGRMGRLLTQQVLDADDLELSGGLENAGSPFVGKDLGELAGGKPVGLLVCDDAQTVFENADVVIDFTIAETATAHAELAAKTKTPLVIGSTGLSDAAKLSLKQAAKEAPVVYAPNMSIGVNLLFSLVEKVAHTLADEWDIEILEMHHNKKADAPSGTAIGLGEAAAKGRGVQLNNVRDAARDGFTGARNQGDIGFAVLRGGSVAGEHNVIFATENEQLELSHKAGSRTIFVTGALKAARWLRTKPAGLYNMQDVIGLDI